MRDTTIVDNVLGKYRLIAELGRGGMAEVYLALVRGPANFSKLLVIKRLRPHLSEEGDFVQMFLDEARLAARLSHPNIVQTIEVGESSGHYYICMEYLEGQPLNRILRRCRTALTLPMTLRIIRDALSGLHHAHELTDFDGTPLNVVHRDATPHNIFVTYNGVVKVVDFGIAKAANSVTETRAGVLKGKVSYMAPEQARGEPTDRRADVFSIGCCLWEILAGQRLWKGQTDIQVLNHLLTDGDSIPPPSSIKSDIPKALEQICMRALAIDPAQRPQSALALRDELDAYLVAIGDHATTLDAAGVISQRFESEQRRLRNLIELQTSTATSMPTGEYAHVAIPRMPHARLSQTTPSGHSSSPSVSRPFTAGNPQPGNGSHPSMRTVPPPRGATLAPPTRGSRWWPALGATAALAASGVGLWILTSSPVPPSSGGAVTAPSNSTHAHDSRNAATSSAATPAATITVSVATTPTNATILLDGEATTNPLRIHVPRDDQQHHVEVRAAGFETFAVTTDFSNDVQLQVALDEEKQGPHSTAPPPPSPALPRSATRRSPPAVAPSASAAPSPPSVAPAPPHATSALEPAPKRTRQLDANNPYK